MYHIRQYVLYISSLADSHTCFERSMAGAEIILMSYGIKVQEENDPYVQLAEEALRCAAACAKTGAYLVDMFPISKLVSPNFGVLLISTPCSEIYTLLDARCQLQAASEGLAEICTGYERQPVCGLQDPCRELKRLGRMDIF